MNEGGEVEIASYSNTGRSSKSKTESVAVNGQAPMAVKSQVRQ